MKNVLFIIIAVLLALFTSCESEDKVDVPDSLIYGKAIDSETGENIQQEVLDGSRIDYLRVGAFENPKRITFNNDGTYRSDLMYSGKYSITLRRSNFFILPPDTIEVKGETEYNFVSMPYIRIKNVSYAIEGRNVVASFQIEQLADNPVKSIALFAGTDTNVSNGLRNFAIIIDINRMVDPEEVFTLKMKIDPFMNIEPEGKPTFYFRVGALISGIPSAKYNYSEPEPIQIDYATLPPPEPGSAGIIDDCESLDGWGSGGFNLSLDTDAKEGNFSIKAEGQGVVIYQKTFQPPFNTKVNKENGTLALSLFVSDVSLMNPGDNSIEITSSGGPDAAELCWRFGDDFEIHNGWNELELKLNDGHATGGDINLTAVNFIRIYHTAITGPMIFKIDNIRFY